MYFLKDEDFIRGNCPMTKEEVRILSIAKMNIDSSSIVLDIGSGTGTITVQSSKAAKNGKIMAIEKDEEAYNVTTENIKKFKCDNVRIIKNEACSILDRLISDKIKFDSIFIGGSNGKLEEIVLKANAVLKKGGTIVMNFIRIDNACRAIEVCKRLEYNTDISLVNISKNKGKSLMLIANNPIYIVQCTK